MTEIAEMTLTPEKNAARKVRIMAALEQHPFRPARWLPGPHAQSVWGPMVRKHFAESFRRERWTTPDGDFLDILFSDGEPDKPVLLLLHGLEGTDRSFYLSSLTRRFSAMGWTVVIMMFRSCSGEMNRSLLLYHLGQTTDPRWVLHRLAERFPGTPLYAAGVSLGANVLLKLLGEDPDAIPDNFAGAAAISPPFDSQRSAARLHQAMGGAYVRHFLKTLIPKAALKEAQFPGCCDMRSIAHCRTFYEFDSLFTAPIHGFADADEYWTRCSCGRFLSTIRRPVLLICALDDPFVHPESFPFAEAAASPWLYPLFPDQGGHVGFVCGAPWRPAYWAEEQVQRFFHLLHFSN